MVQHNFDLTFDDLNAAIELCGTLRPLPAGYCDVDCKHREVL